MAMEKELTKEFAQNSFTIQDSDTAQQCLSLCSTFGLSAADFVSSWEVFYLNSQLSNGVVQSSQVDKFRQFLQHEQREAFRRKHSDLYFYSKDDVDMLLNSSHEEDQDENGSQVSLKTKEAANDGTPSKPLNIDKPYAAPKTPGSLGKASPGLHRSGTSPSTPFSRRTSKCVVQFAFNKHIVEEGCQGGVDQSDEGFMRRLKPVQRLEVKILTAGPEAGCRFMYDRLEMRFNELEKRIKNFKSSLSENEHINASHHVAMASQEPVMVVGRVCCDGEGHLNSKSVLLEGSVEDSGGQRVRLDLHNISHYSLFPGQILVVEGQNPSGHCLVASRIIDSTPLPFYSPSLDPHSPPAKRQASVQLPHHIADTSAGFLTIAAAGPFSTSDNLSFEPLGELLSHCLRKRPNVLLLVGPFLDSEHPQIKQGLVDKLFSHIFQEEIRVRIEEYCQEMGDGARVVLMPSSRDAHNDFVFPQPPFRRNLFEDPGKQITLLPNPALFQVDKITIGCCSMDVLRHLSSEELACVAPGASADRLSRLASHVLGQRSFYPLFPAAPGVPLDLSITPDAMTIPCIPDVLILPSDLAPFVKVLSSTASHVKNFGDDSERKISLEQDVGTLCVNPGRLAKGVIGGTFVEMLMPAVIGQQSAKETNKNLLARVKVSVVRI